MTIKLKPIQPIDRQTPLTDLLDRRRQFESGIAAGTLHEVPGLIDELDTHVVAVDKVSSAPFVEDEKDQQRASLVAALHPKAEAFTVEAIRTKQRPLDEEERSIRTALRTVPTDNGALLIEVKAQNVSTRIAGARDAAEAVALHDEAALSGQVEIIRTSGAAVLRRLAELADLDKGKTESAARNAWLMFSQTFADWRRSNPTPAERLKQIANERATIATLIRASAAHALALYEIPTAPVPVQQVPMPDVSGDPRMKIGPAFDRSRAGEVARDPLTGPRGDIRR